MAYCHFALLSRENMRVLALVELAPSVPSESTLSELLFGPRFLWRFHFLLQKVPKSHLPLLEWAPWALPNETYLKLTYQSYSGYRFRSRFNVLFSSMCIVICKMSCWHWILENNPFHPYCPASNETVLNYVDANTISYLPQSSTSERLVFLCFLHLKHRPIAKAKKWDAGFALQWISESGNMLKQTIHKQATSDHNDISIKQGWQLEHFYPTTKTHQISFEFKPTIKQMLKLFNPQGYQTYPSINFNAPVPWSPKRTQGHLSNGMFEKIK